MPLFSVINFVFIYTYNYTYSYYKINFFFHTALREFIIIIE